ncbi:thioredoxin family protein [Maribacter sp. X9]|uniref:thioredoxin family protein n=1 Tax=Maribacter sp. X9 TaxID=3402159 RepID=UPI003AF3D4A7
MLGRNGKIYRGRINEALIKNTELNDARLRCWDKTFNLSEAVKLKIAKLKKPITSVVLTESWCGEAAPSLPVLNKIAELSINIQLWVLLRDENLELMRYFFTNNHFLFLN